MEPSKSDDAVVDLVDVLLREGAVLRADAVITVADVPLVGIDVRAAVAGVSTMREHGYFEEWDEEIRERGRERERLRTDRRGGVAGRPGGATGADAPPAEPPSVDGQETTDGNDASAADDGR